MSEPLRITFKYTGPEVEQGEMGISDVVEALEGFSGAYSKVAAEVTPDAKHQLRLVALDKHSFDMYIVAFVAGLAAAGPPLAQIEHISSAVKVVFRTITGVIGITNHTKTQPYSYTFNNNGDVNVINAERVELVVAPETFKVFREGILRDDLKRVARPLHENRIDGVHLETTDEKIQNATITAKERGYFLAAKTTTEIERDLTGVLISLNKESNSGLFEFGEGKRVHYHYTGNQHAEFYRIFGLKKGSPVQVRGIVMLDENLNLTGLEIADVRSLQNEIFSTNT